MICKDCGACAFQNNLKAKQKFDMESTDYLNGKASALATVNQKGYRFTLAYCLEKRGYMDNNTAKCVRDYWDGYMAHLNQMEADMERHDEKSIQ